MLFKLFCESINANRPVKYVEELKKVVMVFEEQFVTHCLNNASSFPTSAEMKVAKKKARLWLVKS